MDGADYASARLESYWSTARVQSNEQFARVAQEIKQSREIQREVDSPRPNRQIRHLPVMETIVGSKIDVYA